VVPGKARISPAARFARHDPQAHADTHAADAPEHPEQAPDSALARQAATRNSARKLCRASPTHDTQRPGLRHLTISVLGALAPPPSPVSPTHHQAERPTATGAPVPQETHTRRRGTPSACAPLLPQLSGGPPRACATQTRPTPMAAGLPGLPESAQRRGCFARASGSPRRASPRRAAHAARRAPRA
jgi:hypothetical protein